MPMGGTCLPAPSPVGRLKSPALCRETQRRKNACSGSAAGRVNALVAPLRPTREPAPLACPKPRSGPAPLAGGPTRLSIEYEGIICEVVRRQSFPSRHHFERINLTRCAGNTGFALWDRPSCDESHDQSGNTYSEQRLAHLKSPRFWPGGRVGEVARKMLAGCDGCHKSIKKCGLPMRGLG
jgi:hypothetical protein